MTTPNVNRARIEMLDDKTDTLREDLNALETNFNNYDPTVYDDSFPDTVPPTPTNVRASGLFREIQVMWAYNSASYIASYEVYASKTQGFTPTSADLIWRGKDSGYNHKASLGEVWYFRVRAVNTHGTASEYSEEVNASTTRVIDVEIDSQYTDTVIADANAYTDARETEIMNDVGTKADADYVHGELLLREMKVHRGTTSPENTTLLWYNTSDNEVYHYDETTSTWVIAPDGVVQESQIASNSKGINQRVTKTTYDNDINDEANGLIARMNTAETNITQNSDEILLKANQTEMDTRLGDVVDRLDTNEASIKLNADNIALKVEKTTYDALEGRVTTAEGNITTNANNITLKASQTDLDTTNQRVSDAESSISVNADNIALRVEKDGVISSINQTPETISIEASKINITGDLEVIDGLVKLKDLVVDSVHIKDGAIVDRMFAQDVITNHINAGTALIDYAKIGNVSVTSAQISSLSADKLTSGTIDASVITVINLDAGNITTGTLDATTINVTNLNASNITLGTINLNRLPLITADKIDANTLSAISADLGIINAGSINLTSGGGTVVVDSGGFEARDSYGYTRITIDISTQNWGASDPAFLRFLNTTGTSVFGMVGVNQQGNMYVGTNNADSGRLLIDASGTYGQIEFTSHSGVKFWDGEITLGSGLDLIKDSANRLQVTNSNGYLRMGCGNSSYAHFYTDRQYFYFSTSLSIDGNITAYNGSINMYTNTGSGKYMRFDAYGSGSNGTEPTFRPSADSYGYLGHTYYEWYKIYGRYIYQAASLVSSDRKHKKNIAPAHGVFKSKKDGVAKRAIDVLDDFNIYKYERQKENSREEETPYTQVGLMTDEAPEELVKVNEDSEEHIDLYSLVSMLTQAVKELKEDLRGNGVIPTPKQ